VDTAASLGVNISISTSSIVPSMGQLRHLTLGLSLPDLVEYSKTDIPPDPPDTAHVPPYALIPVYGDTDMGPPTQDIGLSRDRLI